jgi:endonuclease/exonuclease/phosphatase family metal-dependent hydrolase
MKLLSWNIQWGRGADGRVDVERLISVLRAQNPDLICLQEVAQGFPDLPGNPCLNLPDCLAGAFPDYTPVFWPIINRLSNTGGPKERALFGNMVLSRWPVEAMFHRLLPWLPEDNTPSMPRGCLEVIVKAPFMSLRVLTTHLEYYSQPQRMAQMNALRDYQKEAIGQHRKIPSTREKQGPFRMPTYPSAALLCGDFNCIPGSAPYRALLKPLTRGPSWKDAWPLVHSQTPHHPTVGLHGADWPDHPYCCDFVFVTEDVAPSVREMGVLSETAASDHQPVWLTLLPPTQRA